MPFRAKTVDNTLGERTVNLQISGPNSPRPGGGLHRPIPFERHAVRAVPPQLKRVPDCRLPRPRDLDGIQFATDSWSTDYRKVPYITQHFHDAPRWINKNQSVGAILQLRKVEGNDAESILLVRDYLRQRDRTIHFPTGAVVTEQHPALEIQVDGSGDLDKLTFVPAVVVVSYLPLVCR